MRRRAVPVGCATAAGLLLVVGAASPAWAHASFRTAQVDPGESLDAILMVPVEVPDAENARVVVDIPQAFVLTGCDGPFGWTCETSERQVRFERVTGVADEDSFVIGLTAPTTSGAYSFRTEQTLDNGDREVYDGDPFSENPAPVIVVRGSAPASASPSPRTQPASTGSARPTNAPTQQVVAPESVISSPSVAPGTAPPSASAQPMAETLDSADAAPGNDAPQQQEPASTEAQQQAERALPLAPPLLAAALLATSGIGLLRAARRSTGAA
jgi:hypothetical protein